MNITVRSAFPSEADQVAQLWQELIHAHLQYDPHFDIKPDAVVGFAEHVRKISQDPTALVGVAEFNGKLVGFIHASVLKRPPCFTTSLQGQVWDLFVSSSCRRQGVGGQLVDLAQQFFRDNAVEFADVRIATKNAPAIAFWKSMGIDPYITVGKLKP